MQGTSLPAINRNNATSCTDGLPLKRTISDVLTRWCVERGGWNKIQCAQATNVNKAGQGHYDYIHTMSVSLPLTTLTSGSTISHQPIVAL